MKKIILKSPNGNPFDTRITDENGEDLRYVKNLSFHIDTENMAQINVTLVGIEHELSVACEDMQITNLAELNKTLAALGYSPTQKIPVGEL